MSDHRPRDQSSEHSLHVGSSLKVGRSVHMINQLRFRDEHAVNRKQINVSSDFPRPAGEADRNEMRALTPG